MHGLLGKRLEMPGTHPETASNASGRPFEVSIATRLNMMQSSFFGLRAVEKLSKAHLVSFVFHDPRGPCLMCNFTSNIFPCLSF